ncbi:SUF system NifU family Fe-S cluster assembly protein [Microgenomates group bacterium RIFCSPLOWO2_01_FULL_47_10]|nr:MAG: SUF system NifU family Fe-S cluster assembly protein [Microgenomates group bacterium RIFCSPLOWO2_01_FULL_47_10]
MDDIYQVNIIDHYKNPRHFGDLPDFTHKGRGANASCGDMVEMYVKLAGDTITDISFKGIGCALSTAAASMLLEKIKDPDFVPITSRTSTGRQKSMVKEIMAMGEKDMVEMMGIDVSPTRMKCVTLPLRALQDILKKNT